MEDAQAEAKASLARAMNSSGFCLPIHFRLNNAALDFARFCCDGFPAEVFHRSKWTIEEAFRRGFFDSGHKVMLEADDRWQAFHLVITSKFDFEGAEEFLKDKIPFYEQIAILVIDPKSFD